MVVDCAQTHGSPRDGRRHIDSAKQPTFEAILSPPEEEDKHLTALVYITDCLYRLDNDADWSETAKFRLWIDATVAEIPDKYDFGYPGFVHDHIQVEVDAY